jgi:hypothetical protein
MSDPITAEQAVELLNELCETDAQALRALIDYRVPCSAALGDHPTVQVGHVDDDPEKPLEVGMLGIINGLFGVRLVGRRYVAACYGLTCPICAGRPVGPGRRSGDPCGGCGEPVELGKLEGFVLTDAAAWDADA